MLEQMISWNNSICFLRQCRSNLIALHPVHIAKDSNETNIRRFRVILSNLCDNNQIDENSCDLALQQYREMLVSPKCVEMMHAFDENNDRLDSLFLRVIDKNHACLLNVMKKLIVPWNCQR